MALYAEEDLLMLSGIQHIAFCERQYALAYIEMQWVENHLTLEGHHLHERVDDAALSGRNKGLVELRALPLLSYSLGIYGIADVVELIPSDSSINTIHHPQYEGLWKPVPVEYKRGKPKPDERDEVQLCAQAICLEEMYSVDIVLGFLYYGETRHRHEVLFSSALREKVINYAQRMHFLFDNKLTPEPIYLPHCKACSLFNICLPQPLAKHNSVRKYIDNHLNELE